MVFMATPCRTLICIELDVEYKPTFSLDSPRCETMINTNQRSPSILFSVSPCPFCLCSEVAVTSYSQHPSVFHELLKCSNAHPSQINPL